MSSSLKRTIFPSHLYLSTNRKAAPCSKHHFSHEIMRKQSQQCFQRYFVALFPATSVYMAFISLPFNFISVFHHESSLLLLSSPHHPGLISSVSYVPHSSRLPLAWGVTSWPLLIVSPPKKSKENSDINIYSVNTEG